MGIKKLKKLSVVRLLRVKATPPPTIGENADQIDRKSIGQVQLFLASEQAELAFRQVSTAVERFHHEEELPDYEKLLRLLRLQKDLTNQIMECGKALLR
jgi:hypothetical protein